MSLSSRSRGRRWRAASAVVGAVALTLATAGIAFADNVVNDVTVGGTDTIAAGGSTTINYKIAPAAASDPQSGCNADDGSPVTITLSVPAGVTASATSFTLSGCAPTSKAVTFSSSSTGDHAINVSTISDNGAGTYKNEANWTLHVTGSSDTTPPVLTLPANITTEATSALGATVIYAATALDAVDGPVSVTCTPASGSTFPLAVTTVNCSATDDAGNTANGSFTVTVVDTTAPVLTLPSNITEEATSGAGAAVSYSASAVDTVDGAVTPVCVPASGSVFPLGPTTVHCTATDAAGNTSADETFTITVVDTTAPDLTVPSNMTVDATSAAGATVTYTATASDLVDGSVTPHCTPSSGSTFALGTTTVSCTATDAAGNTSEPETFTVTVTVPWTGIRQPINADGSSSFKLGSTVPVKFAAFSGLTATLKVTKQDSTPDGTYVEPVNSNPADSGWVFRYDLTGGQYIYNLGTKNLTAGDWYLHIDLGDGVDHVVKISLRK
jgi:hypothetical protein